MFFSHHSSPPQLPNGKFVPATFRTALGQRSPKTPTSSAMRAVKLDPIVGTRNASNKTVVVLLGGFATLWWSIFTHPSKTYPARIFLTQPAWLARVWRKDTSWVSDLALGIVVHAVFSLRTGNWHLPTYESLQPDLDDRNTVVYIQVSTLLACCAIFGGIISYRDRNDKPDSNQPKPIVARDHREELLPPLLLPSRTTHTRLVPKKHAFSYSYLLVGVPVTLEGRTSSLLSVDSPDRGWFAIQSADFLQRSSVASTLTSKLKRYLTSEGVADTDYAFAYLVTAPRFLGYSFNPVSFWYLYDSNEKLKYMILEVNNTFDERRMYLLGNDGVHDSDDLPNQLDGEPDVSSKQLVFRNTWQKDFHVSPFNSRKGSYSLRAVDPVAAYRETGRMRIDNTIVLRTSKDDAKIVARVFTDGAPQDPRHTTTIQGAGFIARWCWVGFATFPRIAWQAAQLSLKRKLHVWYRPEVVTTSIGRVSTVDENMLEAFFRAFLEAAVKQTATPLQVAYLPAHHDDEAILMESKIFTPGKGPRPKLRLKVLSPAFYSRFVHYAFAEAAFEKECFSPEVENRTAIIEGAELLPELLDGMRSVFHASWSTEDMSTPEYTRWSLLRSLRCLPAAVAYPSTADGDGATVVKQRGSVISELDAFVRGQCEDRDTYRCIVTRLFLSERLAFGIPALLQLADLVLRGSLILAGMVYSNGTNAMDVLRWGKGGADDLSTGVIALLLANSVHLWSFLKG